MNDPGSPRPPRALPLGLLGMLVIVAAVEGVVARHDTELATVSALNWRSAEALARRVRRWVVCVGSSLTTNGCCPAWKSLDLWKLVRFWPEALTLPECVDLSWTARDARFLVAMVVSKALPSARARFEIRARIGRNRHRTMR